MREHPGNCATGPMALLLALAGLAWAMPAGAQSVQKCVAREGHVTFTSGECGAGERLVARYAAVPETVPAAADAGAGAGAGQARHSPRARSSSQVATPDRRLRTARDAGTAVRRRAPPDRCKAARDRREQTLRRVGLKRNFDLLRKLDDQVWDACR